MEDGIEQHMSILIQMQEDKREKAEKVAEKIAEKKQNTLIEEQIHPIGLTLVRPLTNTNSG